MDLSEQVFKMHGIPFMFLCIYDAMNQSNPLKRAEVIVALKVNRGRCRLSTK